MAKPDMPNFPLPLRLIFGVIAIFMIAALLRYTGVM